jgi:hypothetical protein
MFLQFLFCETVSIRVGSYPEIQYYAMEYFAPLGIPKILQKRVQRARKLPTSVVEMNCPFAIIIPIPEKQLSRLDFEGQA